MLKREELIVAARFHSSLLYIMAASMLAPLAISIGAAPESMFAAGMESRSFLVSIILITVAATAARVGTMPYMPDRPQISVRGGFFIVSTAWVAATFAGAIPFFLQIPGMSFTNAYFESMSGFTSTGASVIPDVEALPAGIGFWRCMIQWLGGMGIVILFVAIFPTFGVSGYNLFRAEIAGGSIVEKVRPRIRETARSFWIVYLFLTIAQTLLLVAAGMPLYDAVCHTFASVATGGFSTKNASVAYFDSAIIEAIIIVFMLMGALSFQLHFNALRGRNLYFKDAEFKTYLGLLFAASLIIFLTLNFTHAHDMSLWAALRQSVFSVVSISTTTGFAAGDWTNWPAATHLVLLFMAALGGCVGSTAGGMKILRLAISAKVFSREAYTTINPRSILPIRLSGHVYPEELVRSILMFNLLYIGVFFAGATLLSLTGLTLVESISASIATLACVGPGLGSVGPTGNYAHLTPFAKWVCTTLMFLGRLEIYSILVLVMPWLLSKKTWQREL